MQHGSSTTADVLQLDQFSHAEVINQLCHQCLLLMVRKENARTGEGLCGKLLPTELPPAQIMPLPTSIIFHILKVNFVKFYKCLEFACKIKLNWSDKTHAIYKNDSKYWEISCRALQNIFYNSAVAPAILFVCCFKEVRYVDLEGQLCPELPTGLCQRGGCKKNDNQISSYHWKHPPHKKSSLSANLSSTHSVNKKDLQADCHT